MIRPGTQAAEGLSKVDLDKRMKVETVKRQKLKNENIFISPYRLCVRNLPPAVDDKQLKKVFLKAAGDHSAFVTEVMDNIISLIRAVQEKSMRTLEPHHENQRTNGPVNAHLRSAVYMNVIENSPSIGAGEALGPLFFQNYQYTVHTSFSLQMTF